MLRYRLFLPQHTTSKHRVFALVEDENKERLDAVATFPEALAAQQLADALNAVLSAAPNADQRLSCAMRNLPQSVKAAIEQLTPLIKPRFEGEPPRDEFVRLLRHSPVDGLMLFPTTACPENGCTTCGENCDTDCGECEACAAYDCDDCYSSIPLSPRTARLLHAAAHILADYAIEEIESGDRYPGLSIPPVARKQNADFYRRMSRAYDELAKDLECGEVPEPKSMAEEIALHFMLDEADRILTDEPELADVFVGTLPASKYDYDWSALHDCLFQDKDYEGYLYVQEASPEGSLDHWFELFATATTGD